MASIKSLDQIRRPSDKFDPKIWSDKIFDDFKSGGGIVGSQYMIPPEHMFMQMMEKHREQVTNAVREQIHRHLPACVQGPIGDRIRDALEEVREYHWKDHEKIQETWAYELKFNVDGEKMCIRKQFTLDRIVTDKLANDGSYAIPYSNILATLLLTEEEALVLATAL